MTAFIVNSIPLKDVIISLAKSFGVPYENRCEEYFLSLPPHLGKGTIQGINFENGLGIIVYKVLFNEDVQLKFTLDEIHPVKFIYALKGAVSHYFPQQDQSNFIDEFQCAIVASEAKNGHIIEFKKDILHEVASIEIDRKIFSVKEACELSAWKSKLCEVITDIEGKTRFYYLGNCAVYYKNIIKTIEQYQDFLLARKLSLQSVSTQMFVHQMLQFEDDALSSEDRTVLRINELKRIEEAAEYIKHHLASDLSVKNVSKYTGLNPNKLQEGFKYLFSNTLNEYVTNARLEKANQLLKNKEYNVRAVVSAVGFESSSYFSKIYKQKFGISPKDYKKLFC